MGPEDECRHEMFVMTRWQRRTVAVPLSQLEGVSVEEETMRAIRDWQYWVARGYELESRLGEWRAVGLSSLPGTTTHDDSGDDSAHRPQIVPWSPVNV